MHHPQAKMLYCCFMLKVARNLPQKGGQIQTTAQFDITINDNNASESFPLDVSLTPPPTTTTTDLQETLIDHVTWWHAVRDFVAPCDRRDSVRHQKTHFSIETCCYIS
jgi:hypothetical protein